MGGRIFGNRMSDSPFWGLPVYFYLLFLGIKGPAFAAGSVFGGSVGVQSRSGGGLVRVSSFSCFCFGSSPTRW